MRFTVDRLDHIVITCRDVEVTASWYQRVLGMDRDEYGPPFPPEALTHCGDGGLVKRRHRVPPPG